MLGPATLYQDSNTNWPPVYLATVEIRQVNQPHGQPSPVPGVLLPSGQAAKVALESSVDMKTWRETWPGLFPSADTNRFFRLRLDQLAR